MSTGAATYAFIQAIEHRSGKITYGGRAVSSCLGPMARECLVVIDSSFVFEPACTLEGCGGEQLAGLGPHPGRLQAGHAQLGRKPIPAPG